MVQSIATARTAAPMSKESRTESGIAPSLLTPRCVNIHGRKLATTAPVPMKKLCIA